MSPLGLRPRELAEREPPLREDPLLERPPPELRVLAERAEPEERPEPEPDCLAPLEADFDPRELEPEDREPPLEAELFDFAAEDPELPELPLFAREPEARDPLERELAERDPPRELDEVPPEPPPEDSLSPSLHRPDITRCAASATASAIKEPSRVALDIIELAACDAVSAASSPASRILRRAAGLALIAAAAAARPAASISLLIAALVILSTVLSLDGVDLEELSFDLADGLFEDDLEDPLLADFAILNLPLSEERHFTAVTVP